MAFVAAAIGGAGLLAAGASIYAANKNSQTQSDAANKAAALQGQAMDYQKGNYNTASDNLNPFIKSGQGANNLLSSFYGTNGTDPALGQGALAAFQKSPDYQFALKGGSDALDNSAASKGGLMGGNQIRAQTEYGQGLATQNLQNYLGRLQSMSTQGSGAGYQLGAIGTGVGNSVGTASTAMGNNIMAAGTAQAAGVNGMVSGLNSGINQLSLYNQMNKSSYGGGGGSSFATGGTGLSLAGTGGLY